MVRSLQHHQHHARRLFRLQRMRHVRRHSDDVTCRRRHHGVSDLYPQPSLEHNRQRVVRRRVLAQAFALVNGKKRDVAASRTGDDAANDAVCLQLEQIGKRLGASDGEGPSSFLIPTHILMMRRPPCQRRRIRSGSDCLVLCSRYRLERRFKVADGGIGRTPDSDENRPSESPAAANKEEFAAANWVLGIGSGWELVVGNWALTRWSSPALRVSRRARTRAHRHWPQVDSRRRRESCRRLQRGRRSWSAGRGRRSRTM